MAVKIAPVARQFAFTNAGAMAAGYKLFTYAAGTSTKQTTYTDSTGGTGNSNPIVLDTAGRAPYGIWLTAGLSYKFVLAPATDTDPPTSPVWSEDNISGVNDTTTTLDQWIASGLTPTYVSATSFTLSGDQTSTFHPGRKLKTTNSGGTVYCRIVNSSFGAVTTVTVENDSGTLDSGLSAISYSMLTASNDAVPWTPTSGVAKWAADATGPDFRLTKSRGSAGGYTIVQSGDVLGSITGYGADGVNFETAARITFEVDGTPGSDDMPGRLVFWTSADGGKTLAEAARIDNAGRVLVGQTSAATMGFTGMLLQISGDSSTSIFKKQAIAIGGYVASATFAPSIELGKSRNATIGSHTIVQLGDQLGRVNFYGSDGVTFQMGAAIRAQVDGTPGVADMPTSLIFSTTADGAASVTDQLTISNTGLVTLTAGQLAFPATQNPSSDANTLDDYEEGDWTPTVSFATVGNLTVVYSTQDGDYVKVGQQITASCVVTTSTFTHTTASGNFRLTPFPFARNNDGVNSYGALNWGGITKASYTNMVIQLAASNVIASVVGSGSGQPVFTMTTAEVPTGSTVVMNGTLTYRTSA